MLATKPSNIIDILLDYYMVYTVCNKNISEMDLD